MIQSWNESHGCESGVLFAKIMRFSEQGGTTLQFMIMTIHIYIYIYIYNFIYIILYIYIYKVIFITGWWFQPQLKKYEFVRLDHHPNYWGK